MPCYREKQFDKLPMIFYFLFQCLKVVSSEKANCYESCILFHEAWKYGLCLFVYLFIYAFICIHFEKEGNISNLETKFQILFLISRFEVSK
jgi:hypothetical protein